MTSRFCGSIEGPNQANSKGRKIERRKILNPFFCVRYFCPISILLLSSPSSFPPKRGVDEIAEADALNSLCAHWLRQVAGAEQSDFRKNVGGTD
ncbi:MAG: hypothetical protein MUC83_11110 [Pirellula sp.]|jgi:hypothetical protein|nr:hypothetical protein [Pirellula sp.]